MDRQWGADELRSIAVCLMGKVCWNKGLLVWTSKMGFQYAIMCFPGSYRDSPLVWGNRN